MAALFSTQVLAGDRKVPRPSDLGLQIPDHGKYHWREVRTSEGFVTEVYVSKESKFIEVDYVLNPTNTFKSYEALLSIWEDQSQLTVGNLEQIMHDRVVGSDLNIIDEALTALGHNPSDDNTIYGIDISRDSSTHAEIWNSLTKASFAKDAIEMCTQFQDMSNRYVKSFEIGKDPESNRWVHVKFATNDQ
ncbi:hypothetical protein CFO_g4874 [Ceratocystis platani]|uniref:Uncharacterized protein n=1 Tax=Ceratocystis fimbriata f. sp. platani TaxID=88771 RepID=A0A0F8AZY0_CERFI|nr:hypothetical protein CFO_g5089 [Ceratocystis platani]KKF92774.1 hypothetical protein CFO_g4874 [Ceratocystis platani]